MNAGDIYKVKFGATNLFYKVEAVSGEKLVYSTRMSDEGESAARFEDTIEHFMDVMTRMNAKVI